MEISENTIYRIQSAVEKICNRVGYDEAHDWDGIKSISDVILYLEGIKNEIPYKKLSESYKL